MILAILVIGASLFSRLSQVVAANGMKPGERQPPYTGNKACATCHESIFLSYSRTSMARTSGQIAETLEAGSFTQKSSGIQYRIIKNHGGASLAYERPGDTDLQGFQKLNYFIGSGKRGHSYLFSIDGFLYESPVSYYSRDKRWDISPGFESRREMPFNRPIQPSCLYCHAGQVKPINGTQNGYESPPFGQAGVACEQCHGPGGEHVKGGAPMINPIRLAPPLRDSICEQCHLSGESRVNQPGRNLVMFRPGDLLSEYVLSFVYESKTEYSSRAISHVEAMSQSHCKRRSGDSMSCMSCHDPHWVPSMEEAPAYFRGKCLACHLKQEPSKGLKRHFAKYSDCRGCHMPKISVLTIRHTALTDHRILRKPSHRAEKTEPDAKLVQFGAKESDQRGLALAYAEMALQPGHTSYADEAFRLLSEVLPRYPNDAEVLTRLGFFHQSKGDLDRATALYESALLNESHSTVALVNLGVIYARRNRVDEAIVLWKKALDTNPGLTEAGVNLAQAVWAKGGKQEARQVLRKVLRFNPDFGPAKELLHEMR